MWLFVENSKPVVFGSLFASRKGAEDVLRQFEDGTWVLRVSDAVADHEVTADALVKEAATQPLALMLSIRLAGGISQSLNPRPAGCQALIRCVWFPPSP